MAAISLAQHYQPSTPSSPGDGDIGTITVNDPHQLGGGAGSFDLLYCFILLMLLAHKSFQVEK